MKNICNDLGGFNYRLDKILPNLWCTACNKLLIIDIKWLNLSLSKQPGWRSEIDGRKTDVCVLSASTHFCSGIESFSSLKHNFSGASSSYRDQSSS